MLPARLEEVGGDESEGKGGRGTPPVASDPARFAREEASSGPLNEGDGPSGEVAVAMADKVPMRNEHTRSQHGRRIRQEQSLRFEAESITPAQQRRRVCQ